MSTVDVSNLIHARPRWTPTSPVLFSPHIEATALVTGNAFDALVAQLSARMSREVIDPLRRAGTFDEFATIAADRFDTFVELHGAFESLVRLLGAPQLREARSLERFLASVSRPDVPLEVRERLSFAISSLLAALRLSASLGVVREGEASLAAELVGAMHWHLLGVTLAGSLDLERVVSPVALYGALELTTQGALAAYSAASRVARSRRQQSESLFDAQSFSDDDRALAGAD